MKSTELVSGRTGIYTGVFNFKVSILTRHSRVDTSFICFLSVIYMFLLFEVLEEREIICGNENQISGCLTDGGREVLRND